MAESLPGFSAPGASTEAPLEMLAACHERIARQCQTLARLADHLSKHGADADAQSAAQAVMRYFDTAGQHHHEDEEQDLFPALIESMAGSDARCIVDLTQALLADHRALDAQWRAMRARLLAIAQGTPGAALTPDQVHAFTTAYAMHIAREDAELLPMAGRLLGDHALQRMGAAMRARRGIGEA